MDIDDLLVLYLNLTLTQNKKKTIKIWIHKIFQRWEEIRVDVIWIMISINYPADCQREDVSKDKSTSEKPISTKDPNFVLCKCLMYCERDVL